MLSTESKLAVKLNSEDLPKRSISLKFAEYEILARLVGLTKRVARFSRTRSCSTFPGNFESFIYVCRKKVGVDLLPG